jgi:hypothetical protein
MKEYGSRTWFIPDGEVPSSDIDGFNPHGTIIITNPNSCNAIIYLTFFFRDQKPVKGIKIILKAERMIDNHLNNPEELPVKIHAGKPYSVKIESSSGIIVQHSRLISINNSFSVFTTIAYSESN